MSNIFNSKNKLICRNKWKTFNKNKWNAYIYWLLQPTLDTTDTMNTTDTMDTIDTIDNMNICNKNNLLFCYLNGFFIKDEQCQFVNNNLYNWKRTQIK